jgi:hypothetical protein
MKAFLKQYWQWIAAALLAVVLFVQFGGVTLSVVNRTYRTICKVTISTSPDRPGVNYIWSSIPSPQSRDIHLPLYLNFRPKAGRMYYVQAVDCDGQVLDSVEFLDEHLYYLWRAGE